MKTIAVVSDSKIKNDRPNNVGDILSENIREVFGAFVDVRKYYIDTLEGKPPIEEDLILIMAGSRAIKIRDHVLNPSNIIIARRAFLRRGMSQLYRIPEGEDVLVVNDNIETTLESVASLYNIGIKHVNLIPFEIGKEFRHIRYAVSPSEMDLIPEYIPNTYDLEDRVVDIPTMLLIMSRLGIDNKEVQQNLYDYYQKIFSANETVTDNYSSLLTRTEELDFMLDLSHDAIVLTDPQGRILIHNKKFNEMFGVDSDAVGSHFHDVVNQINIRQYYKTDYINDLINIHSRQLNMEKRNIVHFNKEKRMYFSFQEVTYIKKLEQNLSQKLRKKGQIAKYTFDDIVTQSDSIRQIIEKSRRIAKTDLTVLITGESGTGKEVLAQAIHNASNRHKQPFIAINGSAIPDNLLESELFGYASGSFTGALREGKRGLFELSNNGTIFLDEIGDMPMHLQAKLLRVLQERQITPIGSDRIIEIDVRVIAATHKNPLELIEQGKFRSDLFYRLNVFPIELPPLRDRSSDILPLLHAFTDHQFEISAACREVIMGYSWPGNIRELHNTANYISTVEQSALADVGALPQYIIEQTAKRRDPDSSKSAAFSDLDAISAVSDSEACLKVLDAIRILNRLGKTAGRKHIAQLLNTRHAHYSESALKKMLSLLQNLDFIIVKKGRSGSYITSAGERFLEENRNIGS